MLVQYAILPFLAIFIIVYGFLEELRIFRRVRKANIWLALLMSFSLFPLHVTYMIANFVFQILTTWAVLLFALIFIVGTWLYYKRRKSEWGSQASVAAGYDEIVKGLRMELAQKRDLLIELTEKMAGTASSSRRAELEAQVTKLKDDVRSLEDRLEEMRGTLRSA
ncbi:hypothetical protein A3K63_00775 [Candidatus Micrarchaeota archaeon RBG_16_49_10]|nr:MAG: hypothetical protein A3K63_00775 [Candidatus Micrarchaeota archaeon RBG_16_49_10]